MRIGSHRGVTIAGSFRARTGHEQPAETRPTRQAATKTATGTDLVPLAAAAPPESHAFRQPRTLAAFTAQLIARAQDAPHLRERRRADPAEAAGAYRKMLRIGGVPKRYKMRPY